MCGFFSWFLRNVRPPQQCSTVVNKCSGFWTVFQMNIKKNRCVVYSSCRIAYRKYNGRCHLCLFTWSHYFVQTITSENGYLFQAVHCKKKLQCKPIHKLSWKHKVRHVLYFNQFQQLTKFTRAMIFLWTNTESISVLL